MTTPEDQTAGWMVPLSFEPWCLLCCPDAGCVEGKYGGEGELKVLPLDMRAANARSLRCSQCGNYLEESARRFYAGAS